MIVTRDRMLDAHYVNDSDEILYLIITSNDDLLSSPSYLMQRATRNGKLFAYLFEVKPNDAYYVKGKSFESWVEVHGIPNYIMGFHNSLLTATFEA